MVPFITIARWRLGARYGPARHAFPAAEPRSRPSPGPGPFAVPAALQHRTPTGREGGVSSYYSAVVRGGRGAVKYGALQGWKKMSQHLREFRAAGPEPAINRAGAGGN